jgi:hypothetical protein
VLLVEPRFSAKRQLAQDSLWIVAKIEGRSAADWAFRAIGAALIRAEGQLAHRRNKSDR